MRELNFKVWNTKLKNMTYHERHLPLLPEDNFRLLQYTGLKDKNGTEIYEGDIVIANWREGKWRIVFADGCFMMRIIPDSHAQVSIQNEEVEISGNIYENPELWR